MLLYHVNAGFPVIDDGARLIAPSIKVTPRDQDAQGGLTSYDRFSAPVADYREQVFFHELVADRSGYVTVALVNPQWNGGDGFGFSVRYRQKELPCFNQWKMMGEQVYSVGLEPATNWVTGRASERQRGALQILQPGDQRQYHLEFGVLKGVDSINTLENSVSCLVK
jgi:hypothetical protein